MGLKSGLSAVNLYLMLQQQDILALSYNRPIMVDEHRLLQQKEQQIPGSVLYSIKRYERHPQWSMEDMGMLVYHYKKDEYFQIDGSGFSFKE